jgi:hypothetical protein
MMRKPKFGPSSPRATGRPGVPGRPPKKRKMPVAVRGKTTKKEGTKRKIKKVLKSIVMGVPTGLGKRPKLGGGMSPGTKKAILGTAAGMGGAGLMAMARKLKPTGRINAADLERLKKAMGKKTGGVAEFKPELKKIFAEVAKGKTKAPPGQKPVLDSKGKPVKNLFQKDDRPKRKMRGMQRPIPRGMLRKALRKKTK